MAKAQVEDGRYFWPEGWLTARLDEVEEVTVEFRYRSEHKAVQRSEVEVGDVGIIEKWAWKFTVLDGEQAGKELKIETDAKVNMRGGNQARAMYEAALGREIEVGDDVDTDLILGIAIQVNVEHDEPTQKRNSTEMAYYCSYTDFAPAGDVSELSAKFPDEPPF